MQVHTEIFHSLHLHIILTVAKILAPETRSLFGREVCFLNIWITVGLRGDRADERR